MVEATAKKKALSPADLKSTLYEMSIWHVCAPHLVEKILRQEKGLFQWLLTHREPLVEAKNSQLKFALSFMQFDPAQLDELRTNWGNDRNLRNQSDRYYRDTFYKPFKEAVLWRKAQLTPDTKKKIDALIKNIFLEMKNAGRGVGYAESVRLMDTLIREMDQLNNELPLLNAKLFELLKLSHSTRKKDLGETTDSKKSSNEEKHQSNGELPKEEKYFLKLPDLPFPSSVYVHGSENYLEAKKMLADFIEKCLKNPGWCTIFEHVFGRNRPIH